MARKRAINPIVTIGKDPRYEQHMAVIDQHVKQFKREFAANATSNPETNPVYQDFKKKMASVK